MSNGPSTVSHDAWILLTFSGVLTSTGLPLRAPSSQDSLPHPNSRHHFLTVLYDGADSPNVFCKSVWISVGVIFFIFRYLITVRTSEFSILTNSNDYLRFVNQYLQLKHSNWDVASYSILLGPVQHIYKESRPGYIYKYLRTRTFGSTLVYWEKRESNIHLTII